jgi:hypothetical protein
MTDTAIHVEFPLTLMSIIWELGTDIAGGDLKNY